MSVQKVASLSTNEHHSEHTTNQISVIVVDDEIMIAEGLASLLSLSGITVLAIGADGYDAIALAKQYRPRVVLLDLCMPKLNGIDAAIEIQKLHPSIGIIIVTGLPSWELLLRAIQAGVSGLIFKVCEFTEVKEAVYRVASGESYFSREVKEAIVEHIEELAHSTLSLFETLTEEQRSLLQLIAEGYSSKEIAVEWDMSPKAIENRRMKLMNDLQLHSTAKLVLFAVAHHLTDPRLVLRRPELL